VGDSDVVEVRLLGGLHVVRPDGRPVRDEEWRTTKSADLLRLLALSSGKPVPVAGLLDKFWPEVEPPRAKASLRTALTHIRAAIGRESVVRSRAGLVLGNAWVDVTAYRMLAGDARGCVRTGQHADLVRLARESESLYTSDFEAFDDDAPWAIGARESLIDTRKGMLSDAAESAVELRWFRDAVDFAETAIAIDPGLERAHRAVMRAYAGLGETERALGAFERCRRNLLSALGADPSSQTASVHLQILSGPVPSFPAGRLVGRDAEVRSLVSLLTSSVRSGGPTVVRVTGEPGTGRDAVLDRAVRDLGEARSRVVVCPSEEQSQYAADNVRAALLTQDGPGVVPTVVVVSAALPHGSTATVGDPALLAAGVREREVPVGPLPFDSLNELATSVLAGPVSPTLVHHLERESAGRAGAAVTLLRGWSARGSVVWTSDGLEIVSSDAGWEEEHSFGRVLHEIYRQLSFDQIDLMQVMAVLNRPMTPVELAPLYAARSGQQDAPGWGVEDLERLLDRLTDVGALRTGHRGYEFRHPRLRDATTAWTRPSARRRLQARLVACGLVRQGLQERRTGRSAPASTPDAERTLLTA
jgi:DNA-binding SARP family transcriptional activator